MVTVTFRFLRVRLMLAHESSRKRTLTESCVLILGIDLNSLFVTINLYQFQFFSAYTSSYTSNHHLNFMLVTEIQHRSNNGIVFIFIQWPLLGTVLVLKKAASSRYGKLELCVPNRKHPHQTSYIVVHGWLLHPRVKGGGGLVDT